MTRHWARGVSTTYTHDPNSGEVTLIDYSDATPDVSLSYDTRGRLSTITDGLGTRTLSYGTGSHLLADSLTGVTRTYTDGRLTGLNLGSDYGMTYGYDTYGRFETINAQVAGTGTQTYTYGYLPNSDLLESLTSNHGLTVTRAYEPNRDVLTQVQDQFGTNTISRYDYTNDELAQRTSMTTSGLAFDTSPDPVIEPGTTDYTTNELNQYTTLTVGSNPAISLTYDLDGNLSNDGIHQFTYDAENRLTSMTPITPTAGSKKVEFAYDYMSRRVQKQVYTYDGSSWVLDADIAFVYDGWNLIRETTTNGASSTNYYVWGLDLSSTLQGAGGIGSLLSKTNNLTSKTFLYTFDANGNVGQLVDSSTGTIAAHYEYDPFGNLVVITGSEADKNVFRFSTKYYDVETGLYYYGYRYYDPVLGRWRTRDPIEEDGGMNLYGFVGNNPVNWIDLLGWIPVGLPFDKLLEDLFDFSPSGPDPGIDWGKGSTSKGNCWRYACDIPAAKEEPHSPYPGPFPMGGKDPGGVLNCEQIIDASKSGGAVEPEQDGRCPCGYWKIAVVLSDPKGRQWNDFHYYRQEKDGSWTHKAGYSRATSLDANLEPIIDPEKANRDYGQENYIYFCGYLCVKKS